MASPSKPAPIPPGVAAAVRTGGDGGLSVSHFPLALMRALPCPRRQLGIVCRFAGSPAPWVAGAKQSLCLSPVLQLAFATQPKQCWSPASAPGHPEPPAAPRTACVWYGAGQGRARGLGVLLTAPPLPRPWLCPPLHGAQHAAGWGAAGTRLCAALWRATRQVVPRAGHCLPFLVMEMWFCGCWKALAGPWFVWDGQSPGRASPEPATHLGTGSLCSAEGETKRIENPWRCSAAAQGWPCVEMGRVV